MTTSFVIRQARANPSARLQAVLGERDRMPLADPPELPKDLFAVVWRSRNSVSHQGASPFHSTATCVSIRTSGLSKSRLGAMLAAQRTPCRFCWRVP